MAQVEEKISFARKYRPSSLKEYIGNEGVKTTVQNYLRNGRPQSILLTGYSGCGKTTLARLLVKEYLCENWSEETGSCGECGMCESIDEYIRTGNNEMLQDVYEIDSSDTSGKKDIDSMLSTMEYPAMAGDWKVYIIDEVHLLSQGAMGRLLKSLEEPPEGVLLIFCTTNPEKLLETIKNRCQLKLNVTKPATREIMELLRRVCILEGKEYDLPGLRLLSARSDNVVRDALNNLERVLNTKGNAKEESVAQEFKEVSDRLVFDFFTAYRNKDFFQYINIMYRVKTEYGFPQFLGAVTNFALRGIYILNGVDVDGISAEEMKTYKELFKSFTPAEISHILSSLKAMRVGDLEANFMTFIYEVPVQQVVTTGSDGEIHGQGSEQKFRNDNLQKLEAFKVESSVKSLDSELEEVGFDDIKNLFSVEHVEN